MTWWARIRRWLVALIRPSRRKRLELEGERFGPNEADLPGDLRQMLGRLSGHKGVVTDTVRNAIEDFAHIRTIVTEARIGDDAVFDATLMADAELELHSLIEGAPALETIIALATARRGDIAGRQAAGAAILAMRDRARTLSDAASAGLQWAADPSPETLKRFREHATKLGEQTGVYPQTREHGLNESPDLPSASTSTITD